MLFPRSVGIPCLYLLNQRRCGGPLHDGNRLHRSAFSSNGCTTSGLFDIPTVGFGPADEVHSHTVKDQIPLAQLKPAMAFYAIYPATYLEQAAEDNP